MAQQLIIAKNAASSPAILPSMLNRHGLVTGATGTGKTVTLQKMAESFSSIGIPVFLADVKGDLSGIAASGELTPKLEQRLASLKITDWEPVKNPAVFWDVFGEAGHPVRASVEDMGPLLLARIFGLNDVQSGVLSVIFRIAADEGLPLLDIKDLRAAAQYAADNAKTYTTRYGNIASASIGAIQRGLLALEQQGGDRFFGEPALDIADLMRRDAGGRGMVSVLSASRLFSSPRLYACFLLWLLKRLFESLPEAGDLEKPKLVFFFDEAHLLFSDAPAAFLETVTQVARLIRSKGVGIFFVTQNPLDIPDEVLGQLGNRVQHALRAYTPRDQKAVQTAARTMRANPAFSAEQAIAELGVGEALVSFLDARGVPSMVERAFILAPGSRIGALRADELNAAINASPLYGKYEEAVDRQSAYEILGARRQRQEEAAAKGGEKTAGGMVQDILFGYTGPRGGRHDGLVQSTAKSLVRGWMRQAVNAVIGGVVGAVLGGKGGRRR